MRGRRLGLALALALLLLNFWVNRRIFEYGAQPYRGSIESGYAGISRFFADHPNPWGWNPYMYCGLAAHNTYLPGPPYAVAAAMWAKPQWPALRAYRTVTGIFACLGPVTLFLFLWYATQSPLWSFLAALAYSLCSPSYDLFTTIDRDRGLLPIPWRLHVMLKYGEGPHNMGLMLFPLALIGVMEARKGGFPRIFLGAVGLAAVAVTHWIAAFALAIACLLLLVSNRAGFWNIAAAGVLGYGLVCFWLTPEFVKTVAFNWPQDAFGYKLLAKQRLALGLIVAVALGIWLAFRRFPRYQYLCWATMCFVVFAGFAESHYAYGADAIPEARRYALEMELFLVVAVAEWLRVGWKAGGGVNRFCVLLVMTPLVLQGLPQARRFLTVGYQEWQLRPVESTVEWKLAEWLDRHHYQGRVHVSGGLRFRLNSWFNVPQTNGTFDSGLLNRAPLNFDYRFRSMVGATPGKEREHSLRSLQAMGVEYVVVHGPESEEYYRDIKEPGRFEALFEKVYESGGDRVYRVPFRSLAHLLQLTEQPASWDPAFHDLYNAALNDPARPALKVEWQGTDRVRIRGPLAMGGQVVQWMTSYDTGWTAQARGKPIPLKPDAMGFITFQPQPGDIIDVQLQYGPTATKVGFAAVSALLWAGCLSWLALLAWRNKGGNRVLPNGI